MKTLYKIVTTLVYPAALPYLYFKMGKEERLNRLGIFPGNLKKSIWIHASSMGEVNAVKEVVKKLLLHYPEREVILTTMTQTGQEAAKAIDKNLIVTFVPLDFSWCVNRFMKSIDPELILLVETEFWPNMLATAQKRNTPVLIVNGRISKRSFPQYSKTKFFWKHFWKSITQVAAQSSHDAERFAKLGFKNVENYENLKFCLNLPDYNSTAIRKKLGIKPNDFVITWGSSRPGEEKMLFEIYQTLKQKIENLKIILVPRHLNRIEEVENIARSVNDLKCKKLSERNTNWKVIIVDKMGELNQMYSVADVTIVGGSFFNFGGHNPLEPAFFGKPIIMGIHHQNCRGSVAKLLENKAIIISKNDDLENNVLKLYEDNTLRKEVGENAKETLRKNSESLHQTLLMIEGYLK